MDDSRSYARRLVSDESRRRVPSALSMDSWVRYRHYGTIVSCEIFPVRWREALTRANTIADVPSLPIERAGSTSLGIPPTPTLLRVPCLSMSKTLSH